MPSFWNITILFLSSTYLFSLQASAEQRYIRARRYFPDHAALQSRQTAFVGGWALRALQCPTEYNKCEETRGVSTCCPTNTVCTREGYQNMPICCAKGEECFTTVQAVPICADSSWVLWKGPSYSDDPFCCQQGEMGYVTNVSGRFPACGPLDLEIEATQKATTLRPATARAGNSAVIPKSTATGTASSTFTSSSSQSSKTSLTSQGSNAESNPTSSSSSSDSSSPGSTNSTTQSASSSGLSTGVLVGIIVGVVIVLVVLALLIFFIIRMRRRNTLLAAQVAAANTGPGGAAPAYGSSDVKPVHQEAYKPALASTTAVGSEQGGFYYGSGSTGDELDGREVPTVRPNVPEMDAGRRGY